MKAFVNSELEYYTFLVFLVILAILLFLLTTIATNLCCGICAHAYCFQNDSLFEIYNRQLCRNQKHQQQQLLTGDRLEKADIFEFKQRRDSHSLPVTNYYGILCSDINEVIAYDRGNDDLDECKRKSTFGSFKKDYCDIYSSLGKLDKGE